MQSYHWGLWGTIKKSPKCRKKFDQKSVSSDDSDWKDCWEQPPGATHGHAQCPRTIRGPDSQTYWRKSVSKSHDFIKVVRVLPSYTRLTGRRYEFRPVSWVISWNRPKSESFQEIGHKRELWWLWLWWSMMIVDVMVVVVVINADCGRLGKPSKSCFYLSFAFNRS